MPVAVPANRGDLNTGLGSESSTACKLMSTPATGARTLAGQSDPSPSLPDQCPARRKRSLQSAHPHQQAESNRFLAKSERKPAHFWGVVQIVAG